MLAVSCSRKRVQTETCFVAYIHSVVLGRDMPEDQHIAWPVTRPAQCSLILVDSTISQYKKNIKRTMSCQVMCSRSRRIAS